MDLNAVEMFGEGGQRF